MNPLGLMINICGEKISQSKLVTFLNPYSYLIFRRNLDIFAKFDTIFFDGILLAKIVNTFLNLKETRKSFDMTSLAGEVFSCAQNERKTIFFIGSRENEINKAVNNILSEFPRLSVAGFRNGYFKDKNERKKVLEKIRDENPEIVVVGMGAPFQERFLIDLQDIGWNGYGYTCGGFFHQTAKRIKYYPEWINKHNLRWMYRIYDEPKLIKRYFFYYPLFLAFFLYDFLNYKINQKICLKTNSN